VLLRKVQVTVGASLVGGVLVLAAACGSQMADEPQGGLGATAGAGGTASTANASGSGGAGTCGNGKVDPAEECDLGMVNSCADGTTSACTCTCRNKKCGDGVVQLGECCDDANGNGSEQSSLCTATCTGCKMPLDPVCKCVNGASSSSTFSEGCKGAIFKGVVSSSTNPAMQGAGVPVPWSYKGHVGAAAGKAMCQDVGADHVCTYAEILKAEAKGQLENLPVNLTYWLNRTTNVPDYLQNGGTKTCNVAADCGGADVCDPVTTVCSWAPGAGARCNDWLQASDALADGEWFARSPDATGGGIKKGTLSFHFAKDAKYDGATAPVCQDDKQIGCAGACSTPLRAILCCFPCPEL
jgi:hypothetical protein